MQKPTDIEQNNSSNIGRYIITIVVGVLFFMAGVAFGQGKLQLSTGGIKQRTGLPSTIDYSTVNDLYSALKENYDGKLSEQDILDGVKHGLAQSTKDPYTEYFTASEAKEFQNDLQGTIFGIGAKLELDKNGNVSVVAPLAGSPAEAAGIRSGDIIATVNGKSTSGMTASQAVLKIRGKKGTKVTLGVVRPDTEPVELTITRDEIRVPSVESKVLEDGTGYLKVNQFSGDTGNLVLKAANEFSENGTKKVILDLRDNPGGEVSAAIDLASLWIDRGEVVLTQRRGGEIVDTSRASGNNLLKNMSTVVLVNKGSASASEIVALALRDTVRAKLLGDNTYGKGVVQQRIELGDGAELKVTVARWHGPNGANIDHKGVKPDVVVKMSEEDIKNKNDVQLSAAQKLLNP